MGRAPLNSPESVKAAVLQLLTEGGVGQHVTPLSFRSAVSTRRVRELLGGGDPGWISRQINVVRADVLSTSSSRDVIADLPVAVGGAMRALWHTALGAAGDEFAGAREQATQAIEAARGERDEASALAAMLRTECTDLRDQIGERERKLGESEATGRFATQRLDEERARRQQAEAQLDELRRERTLDREEHEAALLAVQTEYEGLRRQLLQETDMLRQTFVENRRALEGELAACRQLIEQLTRA
ncbi:DNA-binding protein [Paraburkholderia sp. MM5482-R1]|uniref:DNA-binding protein n=1 Tax=unclassified Paraburkholderia TaxID=2615204 RepID=UPI003D20E18A